MWACLIELHDDGRDPGSAQNRPVLVVVIQDENADEQEPREKATGNADGPEGELVEEAQGRHCHPGSQGGPEVPPTQPTLLDSVLLALKQDIFGFTHPIDLGLTRKRPLVRTEAIDGRG